MFLVISDTAIITWGLLWSSHATKSVALKSIERSDPCTHAPPLKDVLTSTSFVRVNIAGKKCGRSLVFINHPISGHPGAGHHPGGDDTICLLVIGLVLKPPIANDEDSPLSFDHAPYPEGGGSQFPLKQNPGPRVVPGI